MLTINHNGDRQQWQWHGSQFLALIGRYKPVAPYECGFTWIVRFGDNQPGS